MGSRNNKEINKKEIYIFVSLLTSRAAFEQLKVECRMIKNYVSSSYLRKVEQYNNLSKINFYF
jgi:hypothetical protein